MLVPLNRSATNLLQWESCVITTESNAERSCSGHELLGRNRVVQGKVQALLRFLAPSAPRDQALSVQTASEINGLPEITITIQPFSLIFQWNHLVSIIRC